MVIGIFAEVAIICSMVGAATPEDPNVLFREDFNDLDHWRLVTFSKIPTHTTYEIQKQGAHSMLVANSKDSASGIVSMETFNVLKYPVICWRWKITNVYANGNIRHKSGDDYPMRVCVVFAYDPNRASSGMRLKYELAKAVHGEYPPDSSLNYVWANRSSETRMVPSPYTSRTVMVPIKSGPCKVGKWVTESRNILEDYRRAFHRDPPLRASLAIMNDSDNTGECSTSYLEFIEIRISSPL